MSANSDLGQILGWGACIMCLAPLIFLFVVVRTAAFLERVAMRHPLLLWMVPIAMWRRAEQRCQQPQQPPDGDHR